MLHRQELILIHLSACSYWLFEDKAQQLPSAFHHFSLKLLILLLYSSLISSGNHWSQCTYKTKAKKNKLSHKEEKKNCCIWYKTMIQRKKTIKRNVREGEILLMLISWHFRKIRIGMWWVIIKGVTSLSPIGARVGRIAGAYKQKTRWNCGVSKNTKKQIKNKSQ